MHVRSWFWPIKDQVFLSPPRVCRHLWSENERESAKICQVSRAHSNVWYFTRSAFGPEFFSSICEERSRNGAFGALQGEAEMVEAEIRRGTQHPITEIDVLWITAGLGCDGDTIAMTAATQPSIEDVVGGALPWISRVRLLNPFLSFENGDDFLTRFHLAAEGKVEPFILVVEGSIPNEKNKDEGYWASLGTDSVTGQPITTCEWIDRLAARGWVGVAAGSCA